jgi:hypothetical protein
MDGAKSRGHARERVGVACVNDALVIRAAKRRD